MNWHVYTGFAPGKDAVHPPIPNQDVLGFDQCPQDFIPSSFLCRPSSNSLLKVEIKFDDKLRLTFNAGFSTSAIDQHQAWPVACRQSLPPHWVIPI